jgi:hypothetical protein
MPRTLDEAIAQLRKEPALPVQAEIDGLTVELRCLDAPTAGDRSVAAVFEELGPWEGESYEEIHAILSLAREEGARRTLLSLR